MSSLIRSCLAAFAVVAVVECAMGAPVASAQELPTTGHYVCCKCGSFFEHDEWTWGLDRSVIALCPDCAAEYEADYGSLEEAATALGDQIHELGVKGRQLHSAYSTAVQDWDGEWNEFWGTTDEQAWRGGTLVGFGNALVAVALLRPGSSKILQYANTGMQIGQSPTGWTNWTGLGLNLLSERELLELLSRLQYDTAFWETLHETGNAAPTDAIARHWARYQNQLDDIAKGAKAAQILGAAVDLYDYAQACDALSTNITDWLVARKEALRLKAEIDEVIALIEALTAEKQCILGEIERRNNDSGDGGGDGNDNGDGERSGPSAFPHASWEQDPPAQVDEVVDFGPLPEPDPTQPDAAVMERLQNSLVTLKSQIEETRARYLSHVVPFVITLRAADVVEEDAPVVDMVCRDAFWHVQKYDELLADVTDAGRGIVQQFHHDTLDLYETEENRERFEFFGSAIRFSVTDWVPKFESWGWSGVVPAGAGAKGRIDIESIDGLRLLPAGSYDVMWAPGYAQYEQPVLLAKALDIKDGDIVEIRVDSGARIEAAVWVQPLDGSWGWWGAAPAGDPGGWNARINWHERGDVPLVLPPGNYDIYWAQGFYQRDTPVRIASNITIGAGELKAIRVNTGVRLNDLPVSGTGDPPVVLPAFDPNWGWWAVVPVGGGEDDWINYSRGVLTQPLVVPPGTYDILYDAGLSSETVRFAENVVVKEGQLVSIPVR